MQLLGIPHARVRKIESLKNGGSWGIFCWKTCGFERVKSSDTFIYLAFSLEHCSTLTQTQCFIIIIMAGMAVV